ECNGDIRTTDPFKMKFSDGSECFSSSTFSRTSQCVATLAWPSAFSLPTSERSRPSRGATVSALLPDEARGQIVGGQIVCERWRQKGQPTQTGKRHQHTQN